MRKNKGNRNSRAHRDYRTFRRAKRAQVEAGFNWVFIIIAGAIILLFFAGVAVWYQAKQETKIAGQVVINLDSIFTNAIESPKTAKSINIPEVPLFFSCYDECNEFGCPSEFSSGGVSRDKSMEVLFTMEKLEANNIITWSLNFNMPYKITNFLYLTNDQTRYVLIYDAASEDFFHEVNDLLTSDNPYLNIEVISYNDIDSLEDHNDDFVRLVSFVDSAGFQYNEDDFAEFYTKSPFDLITLDGDESSGMIYYGSESGVPYYGLPMLLGAIFSPNSEFYKCNVNKALLLSSYVSEVYEERTTWLADEVIGTDKEYCEIYYTQEVIFAIQDIKEMNTVAGFDLTTLGNAIQELEQNDNLAIINDCPRLY